MAHLEHLYYFIAMTIFICCFFASELYGCSRTLSVLFRVLPLLLSFVCCFLHRSITDIHGRCPCYSVSFRCYYHLFAVFLHRSFTDIHGRCPCYSVPFRCYHILFAVFCIGVSRIFTDVVRVTPCHSVAIIISLMSVAAITILLNVCKKHSLDLLQPMLLCTFAPNCGIS